MKKNKRAGVPYPNARPARSPELFQRRAARLLDNYPPPVVFARVRVLLIGPGSEAAPHQKPPARPASEAARDTPPNN